MEPLNPDPPDSEDDWLEDEPPGLAALEVHVTDPEILATLLGPDGEPLAYLLDRRQVPFGFQLPEQP